jgi:hypothetical protein
LLTESLGLWYDAGRSVGAASVLVGLAEIAARGQPRRAARLLGAAQALGTASGTAWSPPLLTEVECTTAIARAALGADAFYAALREGAALSLERAVAETVEEIPPGGKGETATDRLS